MSESWYKGTQNAKAFTESVWRYAMDKGLTLQEFQDVIFNLPILVTSKINGCLIADFRPAAR